MQKITFKDIGLITASLLFAVQIGGCDSATKDATTSKDAKADARSEIITIEIIRVE